MTIAISSTAIATSTPGRILIYISDFCFTANKCSSFADYKNFLWGF